MDWFTSDERWNLYVVSREEYVAKFVIAGYFHQGVPKDIADAFETVSYIMAHSYYHWPMYDEAVSKALLIMEMAVKQKAGILGLPVSATNLQGKTIAKRLVDLIAEVVRDKHLKFLKEDFDRARTLRNTKMHPDRNEYMGAFGNTLGNVTLFANLINLLFLDQPDLQDLHLKRKTITESLASLGHDLYVVEYPTKKILIDGFINHKYVKCGTNELLLLLVNPVLSDTFACLSRKKYSDPLIIPFREFSFSKVGIDGVDTNNESVKIYQNTNPVNTATHQLYKDDITNLDKGDFELYQIVTGQRADWEMEKLIYRNLWSPST